MTDRGYLCIGRTPIPWVVCAMGPWGRDQILGHDQAKPTAWPDPVKQAVRALTQEVQHASRRGERVPFNGLGYQLAAFDVSQRTVPDVNGWMPVG